MAEIIRMPKLSDTMTEGLVVAWHKKVGDKVKQGELLADIETDKATMEFESFYDGVLLYCGIEKGQTAPVNALLAIIGKEGEDIAELITGDREQKTGDRGQETGDRGQETGRKREGEKTSEGENGRIKASPLAKKLAKEKGIPISGVQGTGDEGRVVKRDIEYFKGIEEIRDRGNKGEYKKGIEEIRDRGNRGEYKQPAGTGDNSNSGSFKDIDVPQMRKAIARRLSQSKFTAPHFYLNVSIDMERAIDVRDSINKTRNITISFNDLIVKATATAIRANPKVNVSWMEDPENASSVKIRQYDYIHIGVAVALDDGLVVPVIRFADTKTLTQIHDEIKSFGSRAKNKKISPEEMTGNTFTITNLGMYGIDRFTGIINQPDACILAIGRIKEVPVVKGGKIVPSNMMEATLSCDHRVVDGANGALFLKTFRAMMENPVLFLGANSI
ncbi:MAG: 2-oxo acid dehydrogenase subunit E2 [Bacteroidetes bacterium]|nr:2-oxo acid dehydrogenase subunit E2 [Bacteroidota bacterium]